MLYEEIDRSIDMKLCQGVPNYSFNDFVVFLSFDVSIPTVCPILCSVKILNVLMFPYFVNCCLVMDPSPPPSWDI